MKYCDLELIRSIRAKVSKDSNSDMSKDNTKEVLLAAAEDIASKVEIETERGTRKMSVEEVRERINELYALDTHTLSPNSLENLKSFFIDKNGLWNAVVYGKVKRDVRKKILDAIYGRYGIIPETSENLIDILSSLVSESSSEGDPVVEPIIDYLNISQNLDSYPVNLIGDFLIANHLPLVVKAWFNELISYDSESGEFSLIPKHEIRTGWDSDTEKEVQLDAIMDSMLESTELYAFTIDGDIERSIGRRLTRNSLFAAVSEEILQMSDEDYSKLEDDPYYIIEYLKNKYVGTGNHGYLHENILHSFVDKWISGDMGNETPDFYEASKKGLYRATRYNPIDIFVQSFIKYKPNTYNEYTAGLGVKQLSLVIDDNSVPYSRLCDNVNSSMLDLSAFPTIFNRDKNGNFSLNPNVTSKQLSDISIELFGEHVDIDDATMYSFKAACKQIADFKSQSAIKDFREFLKKPLDSKTNRSKAILDVLNQINAYNPYSVKGTVENALGKSLPIVGLSSVGNSIVEGVYKNRRRVKERIAAYQRANVERETRGESLLHIPVSPMEKTKLFDKHKKAVVRPGEVSGEGNMFIGTSYTSTISATIDKELQTKDTSQISNPEAVKLAVVENFLKPWRSGGVIRIQAITPSDKPKIPLFEFSVGGVQAEYGNTNSKIERTVVNELKSIYQQYAINAVNDFIDVFGWNDLDEIEDLSERIEALNKRIVSNGISVNTLNRKVAEFNRINGTSKVISNIHDYKMLGKKLDDPITFSPYLIEMVKFWNQENPLDRMFAKFIHQLARVTPTLDQYDVRSLSRQIADGNFSRAKNSDLYTYFLLKNVLSEEILINTVGSPLSHKYKELSKADLEAGITPFEKMDSTAHLTMVKRMVALTATMHPCMRNVLSGLSNEVNTLTWDNTKSQMFMYSGNTTEGHGFSAKLTDMDGAMFTCRFVNNMVKQSIGDTKPSGVDLKLLIHSMDPEKASAYLVKMASFSIDNAWLRAFADANVEKVGGINPLSFVELSLSKVAVDPNISVDAEGNIVDYDGNPIFDLEGYFIENGVKQEVIEVKYNKETGKIDYIVEDSVTGEQKPRSCDNDLYSIYMNVLGGMYSCNEDGELGEQSMDAMSTILNKLGKRTGKATAGLDSQANIDQYAKKQIIHYFPSSSVQKSLQAPLVDLNKTIQSFRSGEYSVDPRYTSKLYIENLGIQMDPDHTAEDGEIREISQLMSFVSENGYVPEQTERIYQNLSNLVRLLGNKVFFDPEMIQDPVLREEVSTKLDNLFGERIQRIFADPNLDVMGLANEMMREIKKINQVAEEKYLAPYSDHQMLGKLHTTVGSYFNKFISRRWTGRGDVIMPSHNMCMIYEDLEGNTYLTSDDKILPDGSRVNIKDYLRSIAWADYDNQVLNDAFVRDNMVLSYQIMQGDVYYEIDEYNNVKGIHIINSWDKLVDISNKIKFPGETPVFFVRALDLPRNLRSKQAFIAAQTDNGTENIGLYHFKTIRAIAEVGKAIDKETAFEYNGETYSDTKKLIQIKKQLQDYLNYTVLPAIHEGNLLVIQSEVGEEVGNIYDFEYFVKEDEYMATNNYTNVFGGKPMNFAEISQRKAEYFKEQLIDKFQNLGIPNDYILYTADGKPTVVIINEEKLANSNYTSQTSAIVDEDGYRVDDKGNQLYKWDNNDHLYKYKNGSINVDVVVTTEEQLVEMLKSGNFLAYHRDKGSAELVNKKLIDLDSKNIDKIFDRIAKKQYESWLKSNKAIHARIPSQALNFGMAVRNVAYLPWRNNVAFVPNSQLYLQGSDSSWVSAFITKISLTAGNSLEIYSPQHKI